MAWENLREELEDEFRELTWHDDQMYDRLSSLLMRIRAYKAKWQREKWLRHTEPAALTKTRRRRRFVMRSNGVGYVF